MQGLNITFVFPTILRIIKKLNLLFFSCMFVLRADPFTIDKDPKYLSEKKITLARQYELILRPLIIELPTFMYVWG